VRHIPVGRNVPSHVLREAASVRAKFSPFPHNSLHGAGGGLESETKIAWTRRSEFAIALVQQAHRRPELRNIQEELRTSRGDSEFEHSVIVVAGHPFSLAPVNWQIVQARLREPQEFPHEVLDD
jgi:hypothetical protein